MSYGTIKVDTITFTDNSVDKSVSLSGLIQNPTFTGNITVTGTISGDVIRGGTTVSGATVTGTTANFVSGVFTTQISGATVTGTTASFTSGVFTNISGTTATITSGIIASGTAAAPSLAILADLDTGLFSPGANQLAVATNGVQRLLIQSTGLTVNGTTTLNGTTLSLGAEGGANGFINTPESLYFNIDSNNNETGKAFIFAHNATDNTGAELFRIQDDGKVGVGTSSPSTLLHLSGLNSGGGSANTIRVTDTDTAVITDQICGRIEFETADTGNPGVNCQIDALYSGSGGGSKLQFRTGFAGALVDALHISDTGLVGIGTSSPNVPLDIESSSGTAVKIRLASNTSNRALVFSNAAETIGWTVGNGVIASARQFVVYDNEAGAARLLIDSSGRVGIGTTTPDKNLVVNQSNPGADVGIRIKNNTTTDAGTTASLRFTTSTADFDTAALVADRATGSLRHEYGGSEKARLTSDGKLLVGTSTDRFSTKILVESTDGTSGITIARASSDSGPPYSFFIKSGGATVGSNTVVQSGDALGFIGFYGTDGTAPVSGASITAAVDGTPGTNDMPGRLVFSTTADGAASPTERFRRKKHWKYIY
jgi:hypothetical protein